MHLDLHLRDHVQQSMRLGQLDAHDGIAEGVELVDAPMNLRRDLDAVLEAFLEGRGTRHQMEQMMRVHHVGSVLITRLVANVISTRCAHDARACESASISAK
jgi:hypothetical protein